jgi:hypothetical protein
MTTTDQKTGVCPVCDGTTRRPVEEDGQRYIKYVARWDHWSVAGYQPAGSGPFVDGQGYEGGTFPCTNCGGQYMSMRATGRVPLRADGTPCKHQYKDDETRSNHRRGWHVSNCIHCGDCLMIDSGD